jgi:predicted ArsR family transcriptional regulator
MVQPGETKRGIVDHLKRRGPLTAGDLAADLDVTPTAVRQHLDTLVANGLVEVGETEPSGRRGRPATTWRLTALAAELFPDRHADLTVDLIAATREALGEAGLGAVVRRRNQRLETAYLAAMGAADSTAGRMAHLAALRTSEGYMAEVTTTDDGFVLTEHHCPICDAAATCQGLCAGELDLFRTVLGAAVEVERTEHLLSGDTRCAYRVTPVSL